MNKKPWSDEEYENLRVVHASGKSYKSMLHLWPERTHSAVIDMAFYLKLGPRPIPLKHDYSATWDAILRALAEKEGTGYGLAERIGACKEWPGRLLRKNLESEHVKVHIAHWVRSRPGGVWVEVWALGEGINAVKPVAMTNQQIKAQRRVVARVKSKRTNPFAAALGLVEAPKGEPGRVYIHLTDEKCDELEAA